MHDLIFLGGPSAIGKSQMGRWLTENHGFNHLEFDGKGKCNPVDDLSLRSEWEALQKGQPKPFQARVSAKTIVTLPSMPIFKRSQLNMPGIRIRYLVGPAWACLRSFEIREKSETDGLQASHWFRNNRAIFEALENHEIPESWQVPVFDLDGNWIHYSKIADLLTKEDKTP